MLQHQSSQVVHYLDRAARARERAQNASDADMRAFNERMEQSWMNLAASAAFAERLDLFIASIGRPLPPCDLCAECARLMRLSVIETSRYRLRYTFECSQCGSAQQRQVLL